MIGLVLAAIAYIRAYAVSRHRLALEVAALRQQLVVFKRKRPRPLLRNIDRLSWITFRHWWSGWAAALIIVKPETVASWHRAGFRLFWRLRSLQLGRPKINGELRELIRRMKTDTLPIEQPQSIMGSSRRSRKGVKFRSCALRRINAAERSTRSCRPFRLTGGAEDRADWQTGDATMPVRPRGARKPPLAKRKKLRKMGPARRCEPSTRADTLKLEEQP